MAVAFVSLHVAMHIPFSQSQASSPMQDRCEPWYHLSKGKPAAGDSWKVLEKHLVNNCIRIHSVASKTPSFFLICIGSSIWKLSGYQHMSSREWFINWKLALKVARFAVTCNNLKGACFLREEKWFLKGNPLEKWVMWALSNYHTLCLDTFFEIHKEFFTTSEARGHQ